jgi:hypothetical protein
LRSVILSDHRERRIPARRGAETQPKDSSKSPERLWVGQFPGMFRYAQHDTPKVCLVMLGILGTPPRTARCPISARCWQMWGRSAFKNYTRLCGVLNCPTFANGRQIWATCPNRCASLQAAQVHVIDCACGAYSEAARSVVSRRFVLRSVILSDHRERRIPVQRGAETQPKDFIKKPRAALRGTVSWDVSLRST